MPRSWIFSVIVSVPPATMFGKDVNWHKPFENTSLPLKCLPQRHPVINCRRSIPTPRVGQNPDKEQAGDVELAARRRSAAASVDDRASPVNILPGITRGSPDGPNQALL